LVRFLAIEYRDLTLAACLLGLEGMAYGDVASVLGVPVGTVRSRLSRGRDQLRKLMDVEPELRPIHKTSGWGLHLASVYHA
jgi:hypothetical protein